MTGRVYMGEVLIQVEIHQEMSELAIYWTNK